jgi:hypothetical protein
MITFIVVSYVIILMKIIFISPFFRRMMKFICVTKQELIALIQKKNTKIPIWTYMKIALQFLIVQEEFEEGKDNKEYFTKSLSGYLKKRLSITMRIIIIGKRVFLSKIFYQNLVNKYFLKLKLLQEQ